jgi:hypothetical protein
MEAVLYVGLRNVCSSSGQLVSMHVAIEQAAGGGWFSVGCTEESSPGERDRNYARPVRLRRWADGDARVRALLMARVAGAEGAGAPAEAWGEAYFEHDAGSFEGAAARAVVPVAQAARQDEDRPCFMHVTVLLMSEEQRAMGCLAASISARALPHEASRAPGTLLTVSYTDAVRGGSAQAWWWRWRECE